MAASDFFSRWSKRAAEKEVPQEPALDEPAEQVVRHHDEASTAASIPDKVPDMADVAALSNESDFSRFLAKDVDESVRRSAMKKLFSNPHFNIMDGLDIYIDDYGKADPLPPGMLESLTHAKTLLNPLAHLEQDLQRLLDPDPVEEEVVVGEAESGASASAAEPVIDAENIRLPQSEEMPQLRQTSVLNQQKDAVKNDENDQNESTNKNL